MAYRDPVVIYVNYFFAFQDDKKRRNPADRAASLIQGALAFKDLVVGGSLEPEGFGGKSGPLCSEQYRYFIISLYLYLMQSSQNRYLFNSTRIPIIPSDQTRLSDPLENSHIVVIRKNHFYKVDTHVNGQRLSTADLKKYVSLRLKSRPSLLFNASYLKYTGNWILFMRMLEMKPVFLLEP